MRAPVEDTLEATHQALPEATHQTLPEATRQALPEATRQTHLRGHPVAAHPKAHLVAAHHRDRPAETHLRDHPVAAHPKAHLVAARHRDRPVETHLRAHLAAFPIPGDKARLDHRARLAHPEPLDYRQDNLLLSQSITHSPSRHQPHPGSKLPNQRISRENPRKPRSS